jgi:Bacterial membrane protein YfhO
VGWIDKNPWSRHVVAVFWCIGLAVLLLGPALLHGSMIGSYDLLAERGLTGRAGEAVIGNHFNSDPINQMIPWTSVAWTQVHHGFVPLWNPYNGLGLPLAFNWQSAVFSVPSLLGYLVPLRNAYTVGVFVTLIIAGTGSYVLGRTLRLGMIGALTIATIFELCGPLIAWLGYPQAQTMAWGGWLFAAGLLVLHGRRRIPAIVFLAVITACAIYSGHPETLIVMMLATVLFLAAILASGGLNGRLGFAGAAIVRPAGDAVIAIVAGAALAAPLLLPALQITTSSVRSSAVTGAGVPSHGLFYLLFSSFDGVPVTGSFAFGGSFFYNETAAYVGVIALALAAVGVLAGIAKRSREVVALVVVLVVGGLIAFVGPVANALTHIPALGEVDWLRALMPLCLVIAVLAGIGCDAVAQVESRSPVRAWLLASFGVVAVLLGLIWFVSRDSGLPSFATSLAEHVRAVSFVWPALGTLLGLSVAAVLLWRPRWRVPAAAVLLCGEATLLLVAGAILISSSPNGYPPTHAVSALQRIVGTGRIATSDPKAIDCSLGIGPDANIFYGISELETYDPILPKAYFSLWTQQTSSSAGSPALDLFCPNVTTLAQARGFGLSYVLVPHGDPAPPGSIKRSTIQVANPDPGDPFVTPPGALDLYGIPGSSIATLSTGDGQVHPVRMSSSNPARMTLVTRSNEAGELRVRVTNVPGWRATIDGKSVPLEPSSVYGLELRVPAGAHRVEFTYWPPLFSLGIVIATVTFLALAALLIWRWRRSRRQTHAASTS